MAAELLEQDDALVGSSRTSVHGPNFPSFLAHEGLEVAKRLPFWRHPASRPRMACGVRPQTARLAH